MKIQTIEYDNDVISSFIVSFIYASSLQLEIFNRIKKERYNGARGRERDVRERERGRERNRFSNHEGSYASILTMRGLIALLDWRLQFGVPN